MVAEQQDFHPAFPPSRLTERHKPSLNNNYSLAFCLSIPNDVSVAQRTSELTFLRMTRNIVETPALDRTDIEDSRPLCVLQKLTYLLYYALAITRPTHIATYKTSAAGNHDHYGRP